MRRSRDQRDAADRSAASDIAAKLVPAVIAVTARAKAEGDLFGSVSVTDVVEAVAAQTGIELDRHSVHIDQAIKTVGTHSVSARLHPEVQFQITVEVSPA
jgi:large subunit ribosomal protein L9